jgi:CheY-like chemotaxis protein
VRVTRVSLADRRHRGIAPGCAAGRDGTARALSSTVQPRKVLVADDSKFVHRIYQLALPGVELIHAFDGREAVRLLQQEAGIDLVLLDINMPVMNGLEVLASLRNHPRRPQLAVIVVSTEVKPEDAYRLTAAGADAVLRKAFSGSAIVDLIRSIEPPAGRAHG